MPPLPVIRGMPKEWRKVRDPREALPIVRREFDAMERKLRERIEQGDADPAFATPEALAAYRGFAATRDKQAKLLATVERLFMEYEAIAARRREQPGTSADSQVAVPISVEV